MSLPEPSLLDNLIGTKILNAGPYMYFLAALASMIKSILILHYKEIPGNLNFKVPNPGIEGIKEGKLKVVDKPTPFEGEYWPKILGKMASYSSYEFNLTLTMFNLDRSCFENSMDSDQLASQKPADQDLNCFAFYLDNKCYQLESCKCIEYKLGRNVVGLHENILHENGQALMHDI